MKDQICKAFCETVSVRQVPAGLAVSTTAASINGDPVGFYVIGPLADGRYRLEDSGLLVPYLSAVGADVENQVRRETFDSLLADHHAVLDHDTLEIHSEPISRSDVPGSALRFVTLLLRVSDLVFMAQERAASTFRADVAQMIAERVSGRASIREGEPLSEVLPDWEPDLILEKEGRDTVAVFLVQSEPRVLEAMLLHSEALQSGATTRVVAMLERETSISQRTRIRALNRLDAVTVYEGDRLPAIERIVTEAVGRTRQIH